MLTLYILPLVAFVALLARLSLSSTARLPGPSYSIFTSLWLKYKEFTRARRLYIHRLHQEYGPVVRLGPNEVSFTTPEAIKEIYTSGGSGYDRTEYYTLFKQFNTRHDLIFPRHPSHANERIGHYSQRCQKPSRKKRYLADRYANTNVVRPESLKGLQSRAQTFVRKCIESPGGCVDVYVQLHCFALDGASHHLFAPYGTNSLTDPHDLEMMQELSYHDSLKQFLLSYYAPKISTVVQYFQRRPRYAKLANSYVLSTCKKPDPAPFSLLSKLQTKSADLPPLAIPAECMDHLAAGIDTTGDALCLLMHELSLPRSQYAQRKLQSELRENQNTPFDQLLYLDAVIKEGLRCFPPIPMSFPRYVPASGRTISEVFIPGGTIVSAQPYTLHKNPEVFPDPLKFVPERWLEPRGATEREELYFAFSKGSRGCLGKNLAMAEMKLLLRECNRARPCNICIARNVPGKCIYDDPAALPDRLQGVQEQRNQSTSLSSLPGALGPASNLPPEPLDLPDQIGYSSTSENNAFVDLQKSLQAIEESGNSGMSGPGPESLILPCAREKFRDLVNQLPTHGVAQELVQVFFSEANWYFLVLERYYFNTLHSYWNVVQGNDSSTCDLEKLPREVQYFPALLFQVMAVALQFVPPKANCLRVLHLDDSNDCDQLSQTYSGLGLELMSLLGRHKSTITAVQHDLMRGLWLKNCSRGTESWYSLCDGIRQAQDLGLHLQCSVSQAAGQNIEDILARLWYDEYKRRLWITLFVWDSHMALILGRPRTINASDCTVRTPIDCDIPDEPTERVPMATSGNEAPSSYSSVLFHYALSHKVHEMLSKGLNKSHQKDYGAIRKLHEEVIILLDNLPPAVRPRNPDTSWDLRCPHLPKQRWHISSAAHSFLMALHRPHVAHAASWQAAIQAALNCLESQQRLFDLVGDHYYKIYTLSFYTIDSGVFLSAITIEHPPTDQVLLETIHSALRQAITRLTLMKDKSVMAKSGLHVLRTCYQKIPLFSPFDWSFPNQNGLAGSLPSLAMSTLQYNIIDPSEQGSSQAPQQGWRNGSALNGYDSTRVASSMQNDQLEGMGSTMLANYSKPDSPLEPWMAQMEQMEGLDAGVPIFDSAWSSLLG